MKKQQTKTDSKEHILLTSLNLFLQKNFKEVTMKEIVEKTGLSKGAFYHYFSSKEQVFQEVINHFYSDLLSTDHSKFSQDSLLAFYTDVLKDKEQKTKASQLRMAGDGKEPGFSMNQYFLIFDAARMLPDFRKLRLQHKEEELKAWIKIVHTAKKSGEITDKMSDEKLARLFIYSAKGVGIESVMAENFQDTRKEIKNMWDAIYKQLKSN